MNLTLRQIAGITSGTIVTGNADFVCQAFSTDTRTLHEGDVFVALRGDNFDGEGFIKRAFDLGACGVIATQPHEVPAGRFVIQVADTTVALGKIAAFWRHEVDPLVIAVTGSAGKTTTKEMLAYICQHGFCTLFTQGNKNNHIGLPLTLLRLEEGHDLAVLEIGMNHAGELRYLADICTPDIALLTNVGNAHLGNFGSIEELGNAKGELLEGTSKDGCAIINGDCEQSMALLKRVRHPERIVYFGTGNRAQVRAENLSPLFPFGYHFNLRIENEVWPIDLKVFGRHQVWNALGAAAAAWSAGIEPRLIARRLGEFRAPSMRSQIEHRDGMMIVHDYYNASPDAVLQAIYSLRDVEAIHRRILLFGDMLELGAHSEHFHRSVGEAVAASRFDMLCCVGDESRATAAAARSRGTESHHFATPEDAARFLHPVLREGDGLLIKGSRGIKLEAAVEVLNSLRNSNGNGHVAHVEARHA